MLDPSQLALMKQTAASILRRRQGEGLRPRHRLGDAASRPVPALRLEALDRVRSVAARVDQLVLGRPVPTRSWSAARYVTPQDVKDVALDILRHRVLLTYEAEAEETTSDDIVRKVLESVPVP